MVNRYAAEINHARRKRVNSAIRASRFDATLVFVTAFAAIFISVEYTYRCRRFTAPVRSPRLRETISKLRILGSNELDPDSVKRETAQLGCPCLTRCNRKCMRQGTRRDDLAGCKRRIRLIARK